MTSCGGVGDEQFSPRPIPDPDNAGKADGASCQGKCGGTAAGCYCDAQCAKYGDCCADYQAICVATETPITNNTTPNNTTTPTESVKTALGSDATLTTISQTGLVYPSALAFNPKKPNELWVVNRGDDSSVIIFNPGKETQTQRKLFDQSDHFMNNPTSLAFTDQESFATCQESNNEYNGHATHANYFMGPTRWTSDLTKYNGSTESHYDMLHHSSFCVGIAWEQKTVFWAFNGDKGSLDKYDFGLPHFDTADGLGGHDHSDGKTWRYATGKLKRVANVPSHLVLDPKSGYLYVNDTGNKRIVKLNTKKQAQATRIASYHDETPLWEMTGVSLETVVAGTSGLLTRPSGIALAKDILYVTDNGTGKVLAFDLSGKLLKSFDTGLGDKQLTGIAMGPDGKLYVAAYGGAIVRIDPKD